ncbi:hypothetical protein NE865_09901 [Phthorimaea operculella]|nr:hypothetical protein NE865_09901 [Phthorimaea operculella]
MIILAKADKEEDSLKELEKRIDAENANFGDSERRFIDNLNDAEWHVAHLKSSDFVNTRRSGGDDCKEETFAEKVKRYRKSLKEDAGRMDYVHALPLLVDDKDLDENKCLPNDKMIGNETISDNFANKTKTPSNKTVVNETVTNKADAGTTVDVEAIVTAPDSDENASLTPIADNEFKRIQNQATTNKPGEMMKERDGRRGDYLFSSVEYEEEQEFHFSEDDCPGVIDIIVLEQDNLRPYDIECELTLQWQSYYE